MNHTALETTSRLPPVLTSASSARHLVRDVLLQAGVSRWATIDTAMLLVSEMVTNAVVHAGTPVEVRIAVSDDVVRVEAHDGSTVPPRQTRCGEGATNGRGLALIDELATTWGSDVGAEGKTVWFELHGPVVEEVPAGVAPSRAYPGVPDPARSDEIERRRRDIGISPIQLWLDYLAVGGRASWMTLQRFLDGDTRLAQPELDRLTQALDDRLATGRSGRSVDGGPSAPAGLDPEGRPRRS